MFGIDDVALAMGGQALASAGSSIFGGMIGSAGQQATNASQMAMFQEQLQYNQSEAWNARIWNKEMAETAYQRAVTDMRKAGLNPILAANLGGAIPQGAQASAAGAPALGNPGSALQAGITGAGDAVAKAAAVKTALTQADKDSSQVDLNKSSVKATDALTSKTAQDERTSKSSERLNDAATVVKGTEALLNQATANSANAQARLNTTVAAQNEQFGDSPLSKAVAGLIKMFGTGASMIPNSAKSAASSGGNSGPSSGFGKWLNRPIGTPP